MLTLRKKVIGWGNSAGVYVPREHIGKWVDVQILEEPRLSERYVYGVQISMECYGYALLKPDSFAPELRSQTGLKGFNLAGYSGEEIKVMLPEDVMLELLASPDFRLMRGIPVMLCRCKNYGKPVDFGYLVSKAKEAGKAELLGYILEICLKIFSRHKAGKGLLPDLKSAIKSLRVSGAGKRAIKFPSPELERIYWRTENREAVEATRSDSLMQRWGIAYMPKEREFEKTFSMYAEHI